MDSQGQSSAWMYNDNLFPIKPRCNICLDIGHHADKCPSNNPKGERLFGETIGLIGRVIDIVEANRMNHEQKFHEHVEHIKSLEQDKMHQEKIVEEQARKIEELESTVSHEHFWRVTMIDAPILDLKEKWTQIDQFMCSRIQEAEICKKQIDQSDKRILKLQASLEQAQSRSDGIIAAQAKKIESLEAAVEKLTSQLKNQHQQQAKQHEANLRRIKQTDTAVTHIREKWRQMDSILQRQLQPMKSHHIDPGFLEDSSDEEEFDVNSRQNAPDCTDKAELTSTIKEEPSFPVISELQPKDEKEEFQMKQSQLQILNEVLEKHKGESTKADIDMAGSSCAFEENLSEKYELPCESQLVACVNLINVQPFMKKIEEHEIRTMKSKKKRKLKQQWVPVGVFELRELLEDIIHRDQGEKSFMPQWRKRMRQVSETHDTHD